MGDTRKMPLLLAVVLLLAGCVAKERPSDVPVFADDSTAGVRCYYGHASISCVKVR